MAPTFLGRFSKEWSALQNDYYAQKAEEAETEQLQKKIKKQTGRQWQLALIGLLWEQWWVLWESRNKDLHGKDTSTRARTGGDTRGASEVTGNL
jgi:hypothetical protein